MWKEFAAIRILLGTTTSIVRRVQVGNKVTSQSILQFIKGVAPCSGITVKRRTRTLQKTEGILDFRIKNLKEYDHSKSTTDVVEEIETSTPSLTVEERLLRLEKKAGILG
jgi:hypothetical protein